MKTMLSAKIQRQDSKRKRFEKRTDEIVREGERVRDRKIAWTRQLVQSAPKKEAKP